MALFVLICLDKPNALETRMATREAHLAYVDERLSMIKVAGPFLDGDRMVGSMFILEAEDLAAARAFADNDPYGLAGVFDRVELRPFRITRGSLP